MRLQGENTGMGIMLLTEVDIAISNQYDHVVCTRYNKMMVVITK
jgi:hypothetical protein